MYYLHAKRVTLSELAAHNIHLIPVTMKKDEGIVSQPGYEERPPRNTLPLMRIEHTNGPVQWVHESTSIISYLDEVFSGTIMPDIVGSTMAQRAKTRDIISKFNDAVVWGFSALIHTNPEMHHVSGLALEEMSATTAADAAKRSKSYLATVEDWIKEDVVDKGAKSLSGEGQVVTLADVFVMAHVSYLEDSHGQDYIEGLEVFKTWYKRAMEQEWFVGYEALKKCEEGKWEAVLGA
jgi:glutathione S-transferase